MLKEIFEKNKNIIINTDIDGFLCGAILQKYYDCKIVGFSNSRETIWLTQDIQDIYSPVYIDIFINNPNTICIDQHIIAFNNVHHEQIKELGTKFNPNIERNITFCGDIDNNYRCKYPFGTVHYLIYLMSLEGIDVALPDLFKQYTLYDIKITPGQIIMRADDALHSTLGPYRENALDWWEWMMRTKSKTMAQLKDYVDSCDMQKSNEYKETIGAFFKYLDCDGKDGAFKDITDNSGLLLNKVSRYTTIIGGVMDMNLTIPEKYYIHKGIYKIDKRNEQCDINNIINNKYLFSYAFIYGPKSQYNNFSYTIDMC